MDADLLVRAVAVLRGGGIVAYPTDTVYGLGCDGLNPEAVLRVFRAKERPLKMAVPLLAVDLPMMRSLTESFPPCAEALARRFLPGPLTLVLRKSPLVPDIVSAGGPTVALRIPDHPVPRSLAAAIGAPLVGTSANRSGLPSPTTADEARAQLGKDVALVIEGRCSGGVESTIIDLTEDQPRIIRLGAISQKQLEEALGCPVAQQPPQPQR